MMCLCGRYFIYTFHMSTEANEGNGEMWVTSEALMKEKAGLSGEL